jgi:hypothetical protein
MGFPPKKPIRVYQANLSTIIMAGQGGNFKRTKHLICKESYIRERLENNDMVYCTYQLSRCLPTFSPKQFQQAL